MRENHIPEKDLLERYRNGLCSSEEKRLVDHWFNQQAKAASNDFAAVDLDEIRNEIWRKLPASREFKKYKFWPRIAVAASIILVAGIGFYFYKFNNVTEQQTTYANDIAPGKNGATLVLANGQKILINNVNAGNIASQSGVKISKTADGQIIYKITGHKAGSSEYNTLSTARGEQTRLQLPDGSLVFLNAASSLKYPASFAGLKNRTVELIGEGYFEISKDKKHPFIVKTAKQEVEVLGTHFNINAYADESVVATTLLEGSVKVTSSGVKQILKPGEQSLNNGKSIKVTEVNLENITDWTAGDFYLNRIDFRTAMRKIARWYDVEVIYDASVPDDIESGGWISRNKKLSVVLKFIESSGQVHFRMEGKKVYVSK